MRRLMFSLSATAALLLCGAAFSVAQATPLVSFISIQFTALLANRRNWLSTRRRYLPVWQAHSASQRPRTYM
jgi:hypothetical protein